MPDTTRKYFKLLNYFQYSNVSTRVPIAIRVFWMDQSYEQRVTETAGTALFSTTDFRAGDIIFSCPSYISAQAVSSDPKLRHHLRSLLDSDLESGHGPALTEKLVLTLYLSLYSPLNAHAEPCLWRRELDVLPRQIQNGVWTTANLSDVSLGPAIGAKRNAAEAQWTRFASTICDFETWKWADSIISSRTIGLADARVSTTTTVFQKEFRVDGYTEEECVRLFQMSSEPDIVLVPILDLCNHAGPGRSARWDLTAPDGTIVVLADRDVATSDEITISYGDDKTNEELFFNYGFTVPRNPNWSVTITLPAPPEVLDHQRQEFWAAVHHHFGLSDRIRLTHATLTHTAKQQQQPDETDDEEKAEKRRQQDDKEPDSIMRYWQMERFLNLDESELAALLLTTSLSLFETESVLTYFSREYHTSHDEAQELSLKVISILRRTVCHRSDEIKHKLGNNIMNSDESGTVRTILLLDEQCGLAQISTELDRLQTYLLGPQTSPAN